MFKCYGLHYIRGCKMKIQFRNDMEKSHACSIFSQPLIGNSISKPEGERTAYCNKREILSVTGGSGKDK